MSDQPKFDPGKNAAPPVVIAADHSVYRIGWAPAPKPDNPVRLVKPGTYPARRYSMIGGRL